MDFHGIDLNLLVAFDALMAERSVTRAAKRTGRTQPAMSAALARLRSLFDDELLVRGQNGLQPTARALDLSEPLGRALEEIGRTLAFTRRFEPATSYASFTLGLSDHPAFVLLPRLVDLLRAVAPSVSLRIVSFTDREEAVSLLDGAEADVTIGVPPRLPPGSRILTLPLFEEAFVCVLRRNHPATSRAFDLDAFLALSHVLVSPEGDRHGLVDARLAERGLRRRLAITLPQMYAAPGVVARSDFVATLMRGVVAASGREADLAILPPPLELATVPFVLSWHRRNDAHPAQAWLRTCIAGLFEGRPSPEAGGRPRNAAGESGP